MEDNKTIQLSTQEQFQIMRRLLMYLKPYKLLLVLAFFFTILSVGFDLVSPLVQKTLIDDYILLENFDMQAIIRLILYFVLSSLLFTVFKTISTLMFHSIGNRITQTLRTDLFTKLQTQGMRYFDQTPAGSIVSRVTNDTEAIQDMLNNVLSVILSSVVVLVGILVVMFQLNATLALICAAFIPIAIFCIYLYQKFSTKHYQIAREKNSLINTRLSESISGMKIIQEFNQQRRIIKEFEEVNDDYYQASLKNIKIEGLLLAPIIHVLTAIALATVVLYSGLHSFVTIISVGSIFAFIDLIYRLFDPMFQIMDRLAIYQQAVVASHRIFTILDHQEITPQQNEGADKTITDAKIEFRNVTFSYDGKNNVLNNISFTVNPGETVALVGHTGSGKSSIINVMMRFYDFFEGDILIDGHSIKDIPLETLRSTMGLVLQEPFIYFGTIKDNIRLLNETISDETIIDAAKFVQADSFIEKLPEGYDTQVVERGAAFSTGQKQLLAFARTIVGNPKILVLDEATANIDTETERLIQEGLEKIRQGRTTLAIAHRLSTIKDANQILVLDQGHIVERGNHDSLIQLRGRYYAMYELQKSEMDLD